MPMPNIKSFAKEAGVSEDKIEKYWNKAKGIAEEELGKKEKDFGDKEWSYVMGIVKNMAGIKESIDVEEDEVIKEKINIFFETELDAKTFIEKKCKKEEEEPEEEMDETMTSGSFAGQTPPNVADTKQKKDDEEEEEEEKE